jgi:O-methyltransferase involved in polyketide biosynthesis
MLGLEPIFDQANIALEDMVADGRRGRHGDIPSIMRAVHQIKDDDPKILADPIAPQLVDVADAMALAAARAAEVGDPWLSRRHPADAASLLGRMGFSEVVHLTPEPAHERYLKNRRDGLAGRRGEQLMRAIV